MAMDDVIEHLTGEPVTDDVDDETEAEATDATDAEQVTPDAADEATPEAADAEVETAAVDEPDPDEPDSEGAPGGEPGETPDETDKGDDELPADDGTAETLAARVKNGILRAKRQEVARRQAAEQQVGQKSEEVAALQKQVEELRALVTKGDEGADATDDDDEYLTDDEIRQRDRQAIKDELKAEFKAEQQRREMESYNQCCAMGDNYGKNTFTEATHGAGLDFETVMTLGRRNFSNADLSRIAAVVVDPVKGATLAYELAIARTPDLGELQRRYAAAKKVKAILHPKDNDIGPPGEGDALDEDADTRTVLTSTDSAFQFLTH